MNKKSSSKIWRFIYAFLILMYIAITVISIRAIINIPENYKNKQAAQTIFYEKEIQNGIDDNDSDVFELLSDKYPIEFLVYNDTKSKVVYTTLPVESVLNLEGSINDKAKTVEKTFEYTSNGEKYNIWFVQYNISPQSIVNTWLLQIVEIVFALVAVNFVAMTILYVKFLAPIRRLRDNVSKISKYQLDLLEASNNSEYDQISSQLVLFAKDLEKNIADSEITYTTLEKNLQVQNERLNYRARMLASLTHDLKAPLTNIYLSIENDKKKEDNKEQLERLEFYQSQTEKIISSINDIGKIVYQENDIDFFKKEEFDVVELLLSTYEIFKLQFKNKGFIVQNDIDDKIMINSVKLSMKQIIHNALSNIAAYGIENGEVIITCYQKDNKLYLSFYNDAKQLSEAQLDNVFKLFYQISSNKVGLGTGLYTIQKSTQELGGEVDFRNVGNGVILEFVFDIK